MNETGFRFTYSPGRNRGERRSRADYEPVRYDFTYHAPLFREQRHLLRDQRSAPRHPDAMQPMTRSSTRIYTIMVRNDVDDDPDSQAAAAAFSSRSRRGSLDAQRTSTSRASSSICDSSATVARPSIDRVAPRPRRIVEE